jgi:hypothetical protein
MQIRKNLLVTYGVRYDQYRAPTPPSGEPFFYTDSFRTPEGNFSPRLGISYQPYSKTVVRLNAGIFYEATPDEYVVQPALQQWRSGYWVFHYIDCARLCSCKLPAGISEQPAEPAGRVRANAEHLCFDSALQE